MTAMFEEVDPIVSAFLTGRTSVRRPGEKLQLVIDGVSQPLAPLGHEREFSVRLPDFVFDGSEHQIQARLAGEGEWLKNCPLRFQSNYQGYVHMEPFAGPLLTGWAIDLSRPGTALDVEILLHGRSIATARADLFRQDLLAAPAFSGKCGFSHAIQGEEQLDRSAVIRARILGTHFDLRGSPVLYLDTSRFLKTLHRVNSAFRFLNDRTAGSASPSGPELDLTEEERITFTSLMLNGGNLAELMELSRWFQAAGNQHLSSATHRHRFYTYLSEGFAGASTIRHPSVASTATDVIFYVHENAEPKRVVEAFRRLVDSPQEPPFTVICLLDVPRGGSFRRSDFEGLADGREIVFLENATVRGFPASINAAVIHRERDVVLLDGETLVYGNWLERLRAAAKRSPAAGIVSPFATGGEICCYPPVGESAIPPADLDTLCASTNARQSVDLPAVHGVCAFIRRPCLDEVGVMDEVVFRTRNSAAADFCLRAGTRGWRTILTADTLVDSPATPPGDEVCSATMDRCHPYYGDLLVNFKVDDPALPLRRALDLDVVKSLQRPVYCFLTHRFGGGTERHVRDLCAALADVGIECVVIFALDRNRASCVLPRLPSLASMSYRMDEEYDALLSDLGKLDIQYFHIHSNIAIPQRLMQLPERLGISYYCTIHDYSWFCPRVNLIDESGVYCGEPELSVCDHCVHQSEPGLWREFTSTHRSVEELRTQSRIVLSGARKVFCPSEDTKFRMARQFQLANLEVRGNLEPPAQQLDAAHLAAGDQTVGVAVIGFISRKKGMDVLREAARAALRDKLPLRFVVVGFTEDDSMFAALPNVTITGRYREGEAADIIRSHDLRLALFPIVWPETYSYTLSISVDCGLYPVAFDLGAIAERIRAMNFGHLLPLETSPEDINAALIACSLMSHARPQAAERPTLSDVLEYYYGEDSEQGTSAGKNAAQSVGG
jgi:glycosyltransferase involved in cell wall biosynthesis/GT2 family glycosyltransferase